MRCRIAMTRQAPTHVQGLCLPGHGHVADRSVALSTSHSFGDVDAVIKKDVIREPVDLSPTDRLILGEALTVGCQHCGVCPDLRVACHANRGGGDAGVRRFFDSRMTVPAVDSEPTNVVLMTERYRLLGRVSLLRIETHDGDDPDRQ